jgi:hypothetical protein
MSERQPAFAYVAARWFDWDIIRNLHFARLATVTGN